MADDDIIGTSNPHVDPGTRRAIIDDVDIITTKFGQSRKVSYRLPDDDDFKVSELFTMATTSGSNFGKFLYQMIGRYLDDGEHLPKSELVGREVILRLGLKEDGWNSVEAAWPAPSPKPAAAPAKGNGAAKEPSPKPAPPAVSPDQLEAFQQFLQMQAEAQARIPAPADESTVTEAPHPAEGGAA